MQSTAHPRIAHRPCCCAACRCCRRAIFFGALLNKLWQCWLVLTAYNVVMATAAALVVALKARGKLDWAGARFDVRALQSATSASKA
jgi:hypothetical protein